ncbi:MAG: NADH-quinone oxidoreductase subunit L, partial [Thermoplasmata archaeon]
MTDVISGFVELFKNIAGLFTTVDGEVTLLVVLPFLATALIPLIGLFSEQAKSKTAVFFAGLTALIAIVLLFRVEAPKISAFFGLPEPTVEYHWVQGYVSMTGTLDGLSMMMVAIAAIIGFLIVVYSLGYMKEEEGQARYYSLVLLFIGGMIGLVLTDNLLVLYFFWEIIGLCSYALIGFEYEKEKAAKAGMKAFITTRVGDVGLFVGIMVLYANTQTFSISKLIYLSSQGIISTEVLTWAAIGFLLGAIGKSAQVPLHVWLPDAMEAPTTVSALIHAACLVNSGVYLLIRTYPIFIGLESFYQVVMWVGALTAFMAASMALVEKDLKRLLAYSTVSQLGYMFYAIGVNAPDAAGFHLFNHAIFKALLFLCAGSVIHATGTRDMMHMGGLREKMPVTAITYMIGGAALAGIPIFNGFFSKDLIFSNGWEHADETGLSSWMAFVLVVVGAIFTLVYTLKSIFLVFLGQPRVKKFYSHAHESPLTMTVPLGILA